jgi:hypothetical protein
MAYEPAELAAMITQRAEHTDPSIAAVEAVLLRSALERLDDFLLWLDEHTAREHPTDAAVTGRTLGAVHQRLAREIGFVDAALIRIEE